MSLHMTNPQNCITTPTEDYSHMGRYKGNTTAEMTEDKEYNLIYCQMSNTVAFRNDLHRWCYIDGDMFKVTHTYASSKPHPNRVAHRNRRSATAMDDRPITTSPQPVFDMDDMVSADWDEDEANDAACNTQGIEAITRDVVPEPEGPKSTEELRTHRYTPDLY